MRIQESGQVGLDNRETQNQSANEDISPDKRVSSTNQPGQTSCPIPTEVHSMKVPDH